MDKRNANQVGAAVFLIGLGVIAFLDFWWPGVMFAIAAGLVAAEWVETDGQLQFRGRVVPAAVVTAVGLVGIININWGRLWPIVLILLGLGMLFGRGRMPSLNGHHDEPIDEDKRKNKSVTIERE